jgi:7-cyano-7-deazaguanine reductase
MKNNETNQILSAAPLGKKSSYINTYAPELLFPLPRKPKRDEIGVSDQLPFQGVDLWTGFEISWLNLKGKPLVAIAEFKIPCASPFLIESKSFKLYLNSFNNSKFESFEQVAHVMETDLSRAAQDRVEVKLSPLRGASQKIVELDGTCLDDLDVECTEYQPQTHYLITSHHKVSEVVHTNLLKSNCLVTGQPDWGSVEVSYRGHQIDHGGLLKYVVSLRDHNEFHEQCVERIFMDILKYCQPEELSVYARYTRRGGLDINPYRTNRKQSVELSHLRLVRQ